MIHFPHGFSESAVFAQWSRELGGIRAAVDAQSMEVAETVLPLSSLRPCVPAWAKHLPTAVSYEKAPNYLSSVCGAEAGEVGWLAFLGIGFARLITREADLLSALRFISIAPLEREWAIERNGDGFYRVIAGDDNSVDCMGEVLLHTHRNRIALPSENDFVKIEEMAAAGHDWSFIYSRPRRGPQLCYVARTDPYRFHIRYWRDRRDANRGVCVTATRCFEVRAEIEKSGGYPPHIEFLEIVERSLGGTEIARSQYDYGRYPDRNIQAFWKAVLDRVA